MLFDVVYYIPMETLAKLFGGMARVKIMRLFLLNKNKVFEVSDVASRSRVTKDNARKEINALAGMDFIKERILVKEGSRGTKKKVRSWQLNSAFEYLGSVRDLLIDPHLLLKDNLTARFKPIGTIKLMIVSGVFIGDEKSRADVLIVCD